MMLYFVTVSFVNHGFDHGLHGIHGLSLKVA